MTARAGGGARVLVTVGTDHHPFDRLVNWTNSWLAAQPEPAAECFVQWGSASARPDCPGAPFLSTDELTARLDEADVIVCHGGPGSIVAAWERGRLPIVVPRQSALGEHVDDHQAEFCELTARDGKIALARAEADLAALIGQAVADPASFRISLTSTAEVAVARVGTLIEELIATPRRRYRLGRIRPRATASPEAPPAVTSRSL